MNGSDQALGHVYQDPDAPRRFSAFIRRALVVLGMVATLGPVVVIVVADRNADELSTELARSSEQDDLAFTAVLALAPSSAVQDLVVAAGLEAAVVSEDGGTQWLLPESAVMGEGFDAWRGDIVRRAQNLDGRTFRTVDPLGGSWQHSVVVTQNNRLLVTGRPVPAPVTDLDHASLLLGLAVLNVVLLGGFGVVLYRRVIRPSQTLLDAGEDIRVRGEIRGGVKSKLDAFASAPIELARLGSVLCEIEAESQRGFHQIEALLRSASALGGSLDERTVLDTALEHLQGLLGIERSAILRHDPHTNTFEVLAMRGHSEAWIEEISDTPGHESQASLLAIRDGRPNQIIDTEASFVVASVRRRARRYGYRSILAVPLTGGLERRTTLVLQSDEPRSYSFDEIELSKSFGSMASAALRNAELFAHTDERLRVQTSRLEAIVESVEHGLLIEGADGRVLYANALMRLLLRSRRESVESMLVDDFLDEVLHSGGLGDAERLELDGLSTADDGWVDLELQVRPAEATQVFRVRKFVVRDTSGREIGRGSTWNDVTRDRELERMKSGLLAAVSHEFRTPLALIKGYATTLLAQDVAWSNADRTEFLMMVSSEADRLTELVRRILDMRRIDAGMVALQLMSVDFDVVVESMLDGLAHHHDRIEVQEFERVAVDIDAARITTVLRNLVENACKYSDAPAPVEVRVEQTEDFLHVSVRDYGRGVSPAFRERIFDTFVRGEAGQETEHEGIGLGLAISKGFVEAHNGTVWLRDPAVGPGSVFGFSLPTARSLVTSD